MKFKPLVLIGNGPSISDFDWSKLDGFDTMCMNAFYKVCLRDNYFPTYYHLTRRYDSIWGSEPIDFVKEYGGYFKRVFCKKCTKDGTDVYGEALGSVNNVTMVTYTNPHDFAPNDNDWSPIYEADVDSAFGKLIDIYGKEKAEEYVNSANGIPDEMLNSDGIVKWYSNHIDDLTEDDIILKPRWKSSYSWSTSLDDFMDCGGDTSTDSIRVACTMGYNLFILIGHEGEVTVDKDGYVDESSWGIPNVFNGKKYKLSDSVPCDACQSTEGLLSRRKEIWRELSVASKIHGQLIAVWNCTKDSKLGLEYRDLDDALKLAKEMSNE